MFGMQEGDLMCLKSHVNFSGFSPFDDLPCGEENVYVERRASCPYSERLSQHAHYVGQKLGTRLHQGVYWCNSGPTYESRADIKFVFLFFLLFCFSVSLNKDKNINK